VRAAATDEVLRVRPLGVQGVGGDDGTGDVDAVEKRREHGDFVRPRGHVDLPEDDAVGVVEGSQQVPSGGRPRHRIRARSGRRPRPSSARSTVGCRNRHDHFGVMPVPSSPAIGVSQNP
jgi:hypothetical protein